MDEKDKTQILFTVNKIIKYSRGEQNKQIKNIYYSLLKNISNNVCKRLIDIDNEFFAYLNVDNSYTIELLTKNIRIGFGIEEDTSESGWSIASNGMAGNILESGFFDDNDNNIPDVVKNICNILEKYLEVL